MTWHESYIRSGVVNTTIEKELFSFNGKNYCKGSPIGRPVNQFTQATIHLWSWSVSKALLHQKKEYWHEDLETDLWIWTKGDRILFTKALNDKDFYYLITRESEEASEARLLSLAYECKKGGIGFVYKYLDKYKHALAVGGFLFCCFVFSGGNK